MRINHTLGLVFFTFITFAVQSAYAGPTPCAAVAAKCGGKAAVKLTPKILAAKTACNELNDCKTVCKQDKRKAKSSNRTSKKECLKSCDGKSGKAKRSCRSQCKKEKRSSNQAARGEKRDCVKACRDQWKTPECKQARTALALTATAEGLKCAPQLAAACAAPTP